MRVLGYLSRLRVTAVYLPLAAAAAIVVDRLGPHTQSHVLREASTNLHNLGDGHIVTLVTSAFLTDGEPNWLWFASVAALLGTAEWLSGSRRFLLTFVVGHVGATALVTAGLFVGIHADWVAESLARAVDVGVSYAAAAVAGSMIRYLHGHWRTAWATGWIATVAIAAVSDPSFTAFGHAAALGIGFALGAVYLRRDANPLISNEFRTERTERVQPPHSMTSL